MIWLFSMVFFPEETRAIPAPLPLMVLRRTELLLEVIRILLEAPFSMVNP